MSGARPWSETRAAAWAVVWIVFATYVLSLAGEFVFDDHRFIVENAAVRNPASWSAFLSDAGTADPAFPHGIVRPLRTLEFALDHAVFGLSPAAFHFHSLLWHVAAAVLLLHVLRRLLGDATAAFAATLIWALHPVQVESVAWISSRGDVAMGACCLASVLCALRTNGADRFAALSVAAAAAACLYKETAVALPIVVAVLRWTKRSRQPVWPHLAVVGIYLVYRNRVQPHGDMDVGFVLGGSLAGTFATMFRAFGFYVAEALLPAQALDWYLDPSTTLADVAALAWLAFHVGVVAAAVALRARAPRVTTAVAWFYAFLLPVANWPFFTGVPTTERFLYLPLAGAAVAVGAALVRAPRRTIVAAYVVAGAFAVQSAARLPLWRDDDSMRRIVLADHESPRFRQLEGDALQREALALRSRAFAMQAGPVLDGAVRKVKDLLERSLDDQHRALDELYAFEMVAKSKSLLGMQAEMSASNACYMLNRPAEALFHAEEALRVRDDLRPEPHYDRAWPLLQLGFAPQAVDSMRKAGLLGYRGPNAQIHRFYMDAAEACAKDDMPSAAQFAFSLAMESAESPAAYDEAKSRFDALAARTVTATEADLERLRMKASDVRLESLPRSCPVRRGRATGQ